MDHATENGSSRPLTDGEATLRRPPLQYSLRGLILLTTVSCPFIRHRRWLGMSAEAGAMVLAVLIIAGTAAIALMVAILRGTE